MLFQWFTVFIVIDFNRHMPYTENKTQDVFTPCTVFASALTLALTLTNRSGTHFQPSWQSSPCMNITIANPFGELMLTMA